MVKYLQMDNAVIAKLEKYFEGRSDVIMAYLFGSHAKGPARMTSDWDIGVYVTPMSRRIEYECVDRDYPQESAIRGDLVSLLKTDNVDLIILNRAPATLADEVLRGVLLALKDRSIWLKFMLAVTGLAEDFRQFAREYAEVYWRSSSLSSADAYELNRRLVFLDSELAALSDFSTMDYNEYRQNAHRRREVERLIENVMNAVIDISKVLLASKKEQIPQTYREILQMTGTLDIVPSMAANRLSEWVLLRNVLAHEYLDYRWKTISDFLKEGEARSREFMNAAKSFLEKEKAPDGDGIS